MELLLVFLVFLVAAPLCGAWPRLYTNQDGCARPQLGGEQDRSNISTPTMPVHPPMRMDCDPVEGSLVDEAWCLENCEITGGFPPYSPSTQSCDTDLCVCSEQCECYDGRPGGNGFTDVVCDECDHSKVRRLSEVEEGTASNGAPLPLREGSATILIDGVEPSVRGFSAGAPHNITVTQKEGQQWFLLDVSAGQLDVDSVGEIGAVVLQCDQRRAAFRDAARTQSVVWHSPDDVDVVEVLVLEASEMGDVRMVAVNLSKR